MYKHLTNVDGTEATAMHSIKLVCPVLIKFKEFSRYDPLLVITACS